MLQFINNVIKDFACLSMKFQFPLSLKDVSSPLEKLKFSVELLEVFTFVYKNCGSPFVLCSARVSLAKLLLRKVLDNEIGQDSHETEQQ